ncbi:MAG: hypothetical protein JWQ79_2930 [Mucilaginibacter sp.]|nr:hypothetical protein [Mucilaginibacter sp.]
MILTADELLWVKERMKIYVIKYQEIYDEVLDHIISAIEEQRLAGNNKDIQILFQEVVDKHFNGYVGIEALALSEEKIFQKNIRDTFYKRFKQYFNWQLLFISIVLLALAYKLPNAKPVHVFFILGMMLLGCTPIIYAYVMLTGKIKTIKGKYSLLVTQLRSQMLLPLSIFQAAFFLPNLFDEANDHKDFYTLNNVHPVILMAGLIFLMIINISYLQSCKEIIAKNSRPA